MRALLTTAALCACLVLPACGGDDDAETPSDRAESRSMADTGGREAQRSRTRKDSRPRGKHQAGTGTVIATGDSQFGEALFDDDRRAIYYFDRETTGRSECYGECAAAWPPVLTEGAPRAGGGAQADLLGTTRRDDGATQVTYAGRPLYYYVDDPPGQILCHNVSEFGGLWLAVQPSGEPVA
jgi:predicted lipoprotein with Yx(FWY)xxD motif